MAIGAVGVAAVALAGTIGTASGFEDDDGNLAVDSTFDWNGFSPVTWTGTAPNQTASKTAANGWAFTGLTDAQATSSDSGYSGGVKQDKDCATIKGSKAPNKDDLKRIYLSSNTVGGHIYLNLAWMRIPQNSVNASTHVGFEFNQGTTKCTGNNSDGLVQRTVGDMLIVYDFEGSNAGVATLSVRRWVASGACDISQDSPPCWGPATDLTTAGFAEAKVNEVPVVDSVAPGGDTLAVSEFGEAGVDLTAAGVFQPGVCTAFGQAEGVSRSSGNSGTAAMEDLVGPGHINLSNCGEVIIKKRTDPRGIDKSFSFTSNLSGAQLTCSLSTATSFTLNDSGNSTSDNAANTQDCTKVPIGSSYNVTEATPPTGFVLESLTCTATGSSSGSQDATNPLKANIAIAAGNDVVTCVYVDQQQLGAIKITKTSSKTAATPLAGAKFSISSGGTPITGSPFTTGSDGTVCVGNLPFGAYSVQETAAPTGYAIDDPTAHTVTVSKNSTCGDGNEATFSATDTPLTDISAHAKSQVTGGTKSTITCTDANGTVASSGASPSDPADASATGLKPGTYTCTIVIDP